MVVTEIATNITWWQRFESNSGVSVGTQRCRNTTTNSGVGAPQRWNTTIWEDGVGTLLAAAIQIEVWG